MAGLPKLATLFAIAGGCGVGCGGMLLLTQKANDDFANTAIFIKRAIEVAREEPQVRQLLGDRFEVGRASFGDGWSKMRALHVQVRMPVKGERDNAYLFAYARKRDEKDKLRLYKVEASFEKIANKKLVILDRTDQEDDVEDVAEQPAPQVAEPKVKDKKVEKPTKEDFKQQMKSWAPR